MTSLPLTNVSSLLLTVQGSPAAPILARSYLLSLLHLHHLRPSSSSSPPTKKQRPSRPKKKAPPLKKAPLNGKKATTSTKKKAKALRRPVLSSVHNGTNTPMAPRPRTVSFGGTVDVAPPRTVPTIVNPYKKTPRTVPTVIPIVNDIRVLPSPTTAFIDDDTPPPTTTASTTNSTTNSPVDSTSDSSDFFLDLSGRPSLPPSETDDSDDEADEDDAEADGPPNLLPSQAEMMMTKPKSPNHALLLSGPPSCATWLLVSSFVSLLIPHSLYSLTLSSLC
jgi:hypothetical protein